MFTTPKIDEQRALSVATIRAAFAGGRDYLAACTAGLPPRSARDAVVADVLAAASGHVGLGAYWDAVESSRASFGSIVGTVPSRIAIGSQVSVFLALIAAAAPDHAEVLCVAGDFASVVMPFRAHAGRGVTLRAVPHDALADEVRAQTWAVVYANVQSATGAVIDHEAVTRAAASVGAFTVCDATQSLGWLRVPANGVDMLVCHAYKWLCSPRGVAFAAISPRLQSVIAPLHAGWYAGADPWASCYGPDNELAADATRFDVSPAWQAFVGAAPALELFARLDAAEAFAHTTALAARFEDAMGLTHSGSAIVTWSDEDGTALARLTGAGITASGRAGRARVAFHVFNDAHDVDRAVAVLGPRASMDQREPETDEDEQTAEDGVQHPLATH